MIFAFLGHALGIGGLPRVFVIFPHQIPHFKGVPRNFKQLVGVLVLASYGFVPFGFLGFPSCPLRLQDFPVGADIFPRFFNFFVPIFGKIDGGH